MTTPAQPLRDFAPCAPFPMGIQLLEASAGTGKTYSISNIVLRLIAESDDIAINRILVVTYTEAATAELRERIRARLREALLALESPDDAPSDLLDNPVIAALALKQQDDPAIKSRLRRALEGFDQACISTIHGFCRKILQQNAFESGAHFEMELVPDHGPLLQDIVDDFWTAEFHNATPLWLDAASVANKGASRQHLLALAKAATADLRLTLVPPFREDAEKVPSLAAFTEARDALKEVWESHKAEAITLISTAAKAKPPQWKLNGTSYQQRYTDGHVQRLEQWLNSDSLTPAGKIPDALAYFSPEKLEAKSKAGAVPDHPVFAAVDLCLQSWAQLETALDQALIQLKHRCVRYAREQMTTRKAALHQQSFDDLLRQVHRGLQSPESGQRLQSAIRQTFAAALIDEFQDTDRTQWEIFQTLFDTNTHRLFLIGDPKQAIYGFRGAEIFTYLSARRSTPEEARFNLGTNYRSDEGLVESVNALFATANPEAPAIVAPFLYEEFAFPPVKANHKGSRLHSQTRTVAPFEIRFLKRDEAVFKEQKRVPVGIQRDWASDTIARQTARDISALLASDTERQRGTDQHAPLRPGDIAVLVRTHNEASLIQDTLTQCGIPSVQHGARSVFESREATELGDLMEAVLDPSRHPLIKRALATDLLGSNAQELAAFRTEDDAWVPWIETFRRWHQLWIDHGFIQMFRQVLNDAEVYARQLGWTDGERRVTNLHHLGELLQTQSSQKGLHPEGLLGWLRQQTIRPTTEDRAEQIRLETDHDAVEIVTTHHSKGLEYPVVFCPFLWGGSELRKADDQHPRFFDPEGEHYSIDVSIHDTDEKNQHRRLATQESLAESLRLLYVALTRASTRCVVYWGWIDKAASSPLAYLLHQREGATSGPEQFNAIRADFPNMNDEAMLQDLERLVDTTNSAVTVSHFASCAITEADRYTPPPSDNVTLAPRRFSRSEGVDFHWRRSSFSQMIRGPKVTRSGPDTEGDTSGEDHHRNQASHFANLEEAITESTSTVPLWDFPRGTGPGTFLHRVFEEWDFADLNPGPLEQLIEREAARLDFSLQREVADWAPALAQALLTMAQTPLTPDLRLVDIPRTRRLDELGFDFPMRGGLTATSQNIALTPRALADVFRAHPNPQVPEHYLESLERLGFAPLRGFVTGSIDLVFGHEERWYLADYKSNHLGDYPHHYHPARLPQELAHHHYFLQYHLYTVALHRLLRWKLGESYRTKEDYERHFGGVFYLFLRGMTGEPDNGVYHDRPPYELVEGLSNTFYPAERPQGAACPS
ncbi:MAG: exodeoxyribonuclease V subunit beta [Myxococcota bacterium]|nr:exodeoxyribonuclease V subunit beta [Myxococcota bacterium]